MDEKRQEQSEPQPEEKKPLPSGSSGAYDWIQIIVTALVACILIFVFLGRTVGVKGSSMEATLIEGDRLVISNLFYTPKYGDIVVLRKDTFKDEPIIKRVIATAGQTVNIDFDAGVVYVDGVALKEPYTNTPTNLREDFEGEITVPEGCIFVMGDNRNRSTDSRTASIGCVDTRYIIGKALFRLWPIAKFGSIY